MLEHRLQEQSDLSLVENLKKSGEREYFQEIFHRYQKQIFRTCYRMVRDVALAEDLVQETFIRALNEIGSFDENGEGANFSFWLASISKNLCLDELRKQRTRFQKAPLIAAGYKNNPSVAYANVAKREALELLDTLEEKYRECYLLFAVDGYSYEEVSQITGYSLDKVTTCIRTARRNLEKHFK